MYSYHPHRHSQQQPTFMGPMMTQYHQQQNHHHHHHHPSHQQHHHQQQQQQHPQQIPVSIASTVPMTMTPATPLDFCLDGSLDQALLDMMNASTPDLFTMDGFDANVSSFPTTPEYPLENITLENHFSSRWGLQQQQLQQQKEQDWMLPSAHIQQPSTLFSDSPLSSHFQRHLQHPIHHPASAPVQQQQQQQHQSQQQQEMVQLSHIHPLQTLSPLACDALLTTTTTTATSHPSSNFFFEEPTSIAPHEMLPNASLTSSPVWSSSPASVASSIEDNKPTTPLDTTFDDELIEPKQLELVPMTTLFDEEDEDEDDHDLYQVQQQQQRPGVLLADMEDDEEEELEEEEDEDDNESDPDWSFQHKKLPPAQPSRRGHVRQKMTNKKTTKASMNKSNKKARSKKSANHHAPKSSSTRSTPDLTNNSDIRCTNCETQNTPLWRRDSTGQPLCNACGLFLKLHGVVRPLSLKTDVIKKRNRSGHSIHKSSRSRKSRR